MNLNFMDESGVQELIPGAECPGILIPGAESLRAKRHTLTYDMRYISSNLRCTCLLRQYLCFCTSTARKRYQIRGGLALAQESTCTLSVCLLTLSLLALLASIPYQIRGGLAPAQVKHVHLTSIPSYTCFTCFTCFTGKHTLSNQRRTCPRS
jgi:hypothetical protein